MFRIHVSEFPYAMPGLWPQAHGPGNCGKCQTTCGAKNLHVYLQKSDKKQESLLSLATFIYCNHD